MLIKFASFCILSFFLSVPPVFGYVDHLIEDFPDNKLRMAPSTHTGSLYSWMGEFGSNATNWHVAQWDTIGDITWDGWTCLGNCGDGTWSNQRPISGGTIYGKVKMYNSYFGMSNVVELTQNSSDAGFGCGEYDLFLEPNDPDAGV